MALCSLKCTIHLIIAMALSYAGDTLLSVLSQVVSVLQLKLECHRYTIA